MIVRGTNLPIILTFDDDASTFQDISVMLYPRNSSSDDAIKLWDIADLVINENEVQCPLEQSDTLNLDMTEDMNVTVEIKWMTAENNVEHSALYHTYIAYRKDTTELEQIRV